MFALCTRFTRTVSSQTSHHNTPRTASQARYSSTQPPGTSSSKVTDTLLEKKLLDTKQTSEAKKPSFHTVHTLSEIQLRKLKDQFEMNVSNYEARSNESIDPETKQGHWEEMLWRATELHNRYRNEVDSLEQLVKSKEGEELKGLALEEIAKTEAWEMVIEIFSDMFPNWAPLHLSFPQNRPTETEKGRAVLEEIKCSADSLSDASEAALKGTFAVIWKETRRINVECTEEKRLQLWKKVCGMRQGQLENRILLRMQQTQPLSDSQRRNIIVLEYAKRQQLVTEQINDLKDWLAWPPSPRRME